MSDDSGNDRGRKFMPSITNYNSEDSLDLDDLSNTSVSDVDETNEGRQPYGSGSSSSCEDLTDEEDGLSALADQFAALPVTELIASEEFHAIRKRLFPRKRRLDKCNFPAYCLFFKDAQPVIRAAQPDVSFGELARLVSAGWDDLSKEKKREYRKRVNAADKVDEADSVSAYKVRLLKLNMDKQNTCYNPPCNLPCSWDPRWNGQYCSAICVNDHCRSVFTDWCARNRATAAAVAGGAVPTANQAHGIRNSSIQNKRVGATVASDATTKDPAVTFSRPEQPVKVEDFTITAEDTKKSNLPISSKATKTEPNNDIMYRVPLFESLKSSSLINLKMKATPPSP